MAFTEILKKSPQLAAFLENPTIPRAEKTSRISALFDVSKFSHVTHNLFLTLAANGRIDLSQKVVSAYLDLMQESRGAVHVTIISAEALKKEKLDLVQKAVLKFVGTGKSVDVKLQVEPNIISGLQVKIGDKFLDLSVASRIAAITKTLDTAI